MLTNYVPNNRQIQQQENAGNVKLTAVTIGTAHGKKQFFVHLHHNSAGEAILPMHTLDRLLSQCDAEAIPIR